MKIGPKRTQTNGRRQEILVALLLVFLLGITLGKPNWPTAVVQTLVTSANRLGSFLPAPDLPTLTVDMPFANFNTLLGQRQTALASGVFIASESDFVAAEMRLTQPDSSEARAPVRLRLLPGSATGLGDGEKWPLDVRTRQDTRLLEMSRFTLQDPAGNSWLNQWLFAKSLTQAGLLAPRYTFVQLIFNGEERGIYALQEGFSDELLTANGRLPGVLVEFDAQRLWQSVAHFDGDLAAAFADPATNLSLDDYRFFEVDTFRDRTIAQDALLTAQKNSAIGLLRSLQTGKAAAGQIFDAARYGAFLAHVDLWAATDALQLVNLRFYYNPNSGQLEPIAYNGNPLSSNGRLTPAHFFNDPTIQEAYVQTAVALANPAYLDQLEATFGPEVERLRRSLAREAALELPWAALRQRQKLLQQTLNPVQPAFVYLGSPELTTQAIIEIDIANALNLPLEIVGFDIGGATFLEARADWIQGDASDLLLEGSNGRLLLKGVGTNPSTPPCYVRFHLSLIDIQRQDSELDYSRGFDIQVATRLAGLNQGYQLSLARPGYPVLPGAN